MNLFAIIVVSAVLTNVISLFLIFYLKRQHSAWFNNMFRFAYRIHDEISSPLREILETFCVIQQLHYGMLLFVMFLYIGNLAIYISNDLHTSTLPYIDFIVGVAYNYPGYIKRAMFLFIAAMIVLLNFNINTIKSFIVGFNYRQRLQFSVLKSILPFCLVMSPLILLALVHWSVSLVSLFSYLLFNQPYTPAFIKP